MSRTVNIVGAKVEVEPRRLGDFGMMVMGDHAVEKDKNKRGQMYVELCEDIAKEIKRHVNSIGSIHVIPETEEVCSYCGADWTEPKDSPHNGGCCSKDCKFIPDYEA